MLSYTKPGQLSSSLQQNRRQATRSATSESPILPREGVPLTCSQDLRPICSSLQHLPASSPSAQYTLSPSKYRYYRLFPLRELADSPTEIGRFGASESQKPSTLGAAGLLLSSSASTFEPLCVRGCVCEWTGGIYRSLSNFDSASMHPRALPRRLALFRYQTPLDTGAPRAAPELRVSPLCLRLGISTLPPSYLLYSIQFFNFFFIFHFFSYLFFIIFSLKLPGAHIDRSW